MAELKIIIKNFNSENFSFLFQQGVDIKVRTGISVRDLLCKILGLSPEYVENRISTIFLDSKPVDDLDSSYVKDKSTISLSAAMPGLVGATMRRGGFYASLRNGISYKDDGSRNEVDGIVRIRLFNIIKKEIGEDLLRKGIYVSCEDIKLLIKNGANDFIQNVANVIMEGKEIKPERILTDSILHKCDIVFLKLISDS